MEIVNIRHKSLRQLAEQGTTKGLMATERLIDMLAFIVAAESIDDLSVPPNFGLHALSGDRRGTWAMTVTRNWRMTFWLNETGAICDLDLEDYH